MRRQGIARSERWGWVPAVLTLIIAAATSYELAVNARWVDMMFFGIAIPVIGVVEWLIVRRRGGEARPAADRMMMGFMIATLAINMLVGQGGPP